MAHQMWNPTAVNKGAWLQSYGLAATLEVKISAFVSGLVPISAAERESERERGKKEKRRDTTADKMFRRCFLTEEVGVTVF